MIATATTSRRQTRYCDWGSLRKWKVIMKTSNTQGRTFGSTVGRIMMALACASMIGGIFITPAFSDDHGKHKGYQKQRRYKHYRRVEPRPHYYYSEPVYAPPPVIYAPDRYLSPGISIVFPPIHIR